MDGHTLPRRLLGLAAATLLAATTVAATAHAAALDTTKALEKAKWADSVRVSFSGGLLRWQSNGIPNHKIAGAYAIPDDGVYVPDASTSHVEQASDVVKQQTYDYRITTKPRVARKPTDVLAGPIGVMISGGLLFNPYEADGTTIAAASQFTIEDASGNDVAFIDDCNGHPTPVGQYHYHALPTCVTKQVDKKGGPSHIIGVAWDGFPVYGDRNAKGKKVKPGALDACNGIKSATPEFPKGIYHYVLLDVQTAQSSPACLSGTPTDGVPIVPRDSEQAQQAQGQSRAVDLFLCTAPAGVAAVPTFTAR